MVCSSVYQCHNDTIRNKTHYRFSDHFADFLQCFLFTHSGEVEDRCKHAIWFDFIAAEGSTPNLDMKVSPEFTRPSLSRRSMYCRDFDLCLSIR